MLPLLTDGFLFLGSANFWRNGTNEEVGSVAISGCRKKWQLGKKPSFMGDQNATFNFASTHWTIINEDQQ